MERDILKKAAAYFAKESARYAAMNELRLKVRIATDYECIGQRLLCVSTAVHAGQEEVRLDWR